MERPPPDSSVKMIQIRVWSAMEGLEELDMKKEIESKFLSISVSYGMYLCSRHVKKLPEGQHRFSKYCRPQLTTEYDGLYWSTPTSRPMPLKRSLPPSSAKPIPKRPKTKEEDRLEAENLELKEKMKEMSKKLRALEGKVKCLERNLEHHPISSPIDAILEKNMDPDTCLEWFGVSSFVSFHALVQSHLRNYRGMAYDRKRKLERFLIQLRNSFTCRVAIPLLEPQKSTSSFMNLFRHGLDDLYPWALEQIRLPTVKEWKEMNTEQMKEIFPGFLCFFVDRTVLEIWNPKDVRKHRENYNSKHGYTAISFFIVCTPNGEIVYLSKPDTSATHDSTAWNTALAWPPLELHNGKCADHSDGKLFVTHLSEVYGEAANVESKQTFAIGGDKAYPFILLPSGWSLFVTMTAGKESAIAEASAAASETKKIFTKNHLRVPKLVHLIADDPRRH